MLATCLGCGCACDDIQLHVESDRILESHNACALGARWFGDGSVPTRCLVRGKDASVTDGLNAAASILRSAARPVVYLAPDISCETQRAAIAIADVLHATIDSVTSATVSGTVLASQEAGRASATLGEIRNRADVVVFWGVDPVHRYPRFWTRYAPEPVGVHVGGRRERIVIAVDVGSAHGPEDADVRLTVMPDREVATLTQLTAAISSSSDRVAGAAVAARTSAPPPGGDALQAMLNGKYVAVIADAEPDDQNPTRDRGRSAALIAFTQALNATTRCAMISLRGGGNRSGADASLTAQTGYPMAVEFTGGHPRFRPHGGAAATIARSSVDALLIVGAAAQLPAHVTAAASEIPTIAIGPRASESPFAGGEVAIDTAVVGVHESGTVLRMDDVPLPAAAAISGPAAAADIVTALAGSITPGPIARVAANRP